jgi:hypothetical protein
VQNATASVDTNGVVSVTPNAGFTGVITLLLGVRDNQPHQGRPTNLDNPDAFDTETITLTVRSGDVVNLPPIAVSTTATAVANQPNSLQLTGQTANPGQATQTLTYTIVASPANGSITQFNPNTGTFVYTPSRNFLGTDTVRFLVTDAGAPGPSLSSQVATLTILVGGTRTGSVRLLDGVLLVSAPPRRSGTNNIRVEEVGGAIRVLINGRFDSVQPATGDVDRIVVYGSTANDRIVVDPSITQPTTLNGGRGGRNVLRAGGGKSRLHGWWGQNTLVGGPARNALVGRQKHVEFRPSADTTVMYAGQGYLGNFDDKAVYPTSAFGVFPDGPPKGTYFRQQGGRIVEAPTPPQRIVRIDRTRIGTSSVPNLQFGSPPWGER